ncbi:MAG: lipopolysaccharide heptosyltransferase II [Acidobacteriota bacterium]|nr:lipopolysaccharide heptosyltransferase II [Acidobacteriota bacterium]
MRPIRCLVVSANWVGDTVMALPVLDALSAAGRQLTVLARPHLHPLLALSPAVHALLETARSNGETVQRLRAGAFEEAILLPNSFRSAWLVHRARIPSRWGYRADGRSLLLRPAVHRPAVQLHQRQDYDRLLKRMGASPVTTHPELIVSDAASKTGDSALRRAEIAIDHKSPLVGLFAAAEFGPSKRWRLDHFAATARILEDPTFGARTLVLAGPKEVSLAKALNNRVGKSLPVVGPDLDLAALAAVLARLDVLITNDSGPMHIAAAVGTPCVALFGPTDPQRTAPVGSGHHVLFTGRWCAPCFRRHCPLLHHRCMKEIGVENVIEATRKVIGWRSAEQHGS